MDPLYAPESSTRPSLDREGRCALHLAARRHARLPAHDWSCPGVAFHRRARVYRNGHRLCRDALHHGTVETHRADVAAGSCAGVEHLRALCDVSSAAGAKWILRLQRIATDRLFHSRVCIRGDRDSDRHSDVSGGGQPVPVVRPYVRGTAIGPFYPFLDNVRFPCIFDRARDSDRDDGICAQYEPHCDGHRRSEPCRNVLGIHWNRCRRTLMDRGALHFLEPSAGSATCPEVGDVSNAASYAEPALATAEVCGGGNLSVFLAERKDAAPG